MKNVAVRDEYTLMALFERYGTYHAVIRRDNVNVDKWVYCFAYDINDGTWGQGHYYGRYKDALDDLWGHIK